MYILICKYIWEHKPRFDWFISSYQNQMRNKTEIKECSNIKWEEKLGWKLVNEKKIQSYKLMWTY